MAIKIRINSIFLSALLTLGLSSSVQASTCSKVEGEWFEYAGGHLKEHSTDVIDSFVVTGTNNHLKAFNTNVFNEWTRGSEYLTNVVHFFFQYHLNAALVKTNTGQIVQKKSPWVKNLEITVESGELPRETLKHILNQSRAKAVASAADYFWNNSGVTRSLISEISNPNSSMAVSGRFVFSENRQYLQPLSQSQRLKLETKLKQYFSERQTFESLMNKEYSLGIGKTVYDSHFAAKISAASSSGHVVSFEMSTLLKVLIGARNQRQSMQHIFEGKSEKETVELFALTRKYIDADPSTWPKALLDIAAVPRNETTAPGSQSIKDFVSRMKKFVRTLNFLDYLPEEFTKTDSDAAKKISELKDPDAVLFLDVKGLGARNYNTFMKEIDPLYKDVSELKSILDRAGQSLEGPERQAAEAIVDRIAAKRKFILAESNELLSLIKEELIRVTIKAGVDRKDFEYWASGDDIFLVASAARSGSSTEALIAEVTRSEMLVNENRISYWLPSRPQVTLDGARNRLGGLVHFQKAIEGMNYGYKTTTYMTDKMIEKGSVGVWELDMSVGRRPIETGHRESMQALATGWTVDF
ncbi:hypothetical protein N9D31_02420 [Oligoflexaceae bacterium]|nr:hypothetical protein [Oligoflexaceae bacterium]